eukprot:gene16831-22805_t
MILNHNWIPQQHWTPVRIRNGTMHVFHITPKTPSARTQPPTQLASVNPRTLR